MSNQKHVEFLIAGGSVAKMKYVIIPKKLGIDYLISEKYGQIAPDRYLAAVGAAAWAVFAAKHAQAYVWGLPVALLSVQGR